MKNDINETLVKKLIVYSEEADDLLKDPTVSSCIHIQLWWHDFLTS